MFEILKSNSIFWVIYIYFLVDLSINSNNCFLQRILGDIACESNISENNFYRHRSLESQS